MSSTLGTGRLGPMTGNSKLEQMMQGMSLNSEEALILFTPDRPCATVRTKNQVIRRALLTVIFAVLAPCHSSALICSWGKCLRTENEQLD